jgi:hypothetical protein
MDDNQTDSPKSTLLTRRNALRSLGVVTAGAIAAQAAKARADTRFPTTLPQPGARVDSYGWSPKLHSEAEDYFIIDGVAHCYNHADWNRRNRTAAMNALDTGYAFHAWSTPTRYRMTEAGYNRDWQAEEVMDVMFLESATDMIVMHSVPIYDVFWDGLISNEKGAYMKGKYPDRVIWYGAIDAFDTLDNIKTKIDQLAVQGADGLKMYPTRVNIYSHQKESFFLDDEKKSFPIIEYARGKGFKHIAVHKVAGYVDATTPALGINDYYKAAAQFPDVTFHIIHAGWLLLDETAALMRQRENVTAVLEGPMIWPQYDMDSYNQMWASFMPNVDVNRIIYASTSPNQHPYWIINDFVDYTPPAGSKFTITKADKAKILGANLARYHGIDIAKRTAQLKNDKYGLARTANGYREPYIVQRTEKA